MMKEVRGHDTVPEDLFAKKKSHTLYTIMARTYFADCLKVLHWPMALGGCDLGNCYDRDSIASVGYCHAHHLFR